MIRTYGWITVVTMAVALLAGGRLFAADKLLLVETLKHTVLAAAQPSRLSPALLATKAAGGTLKGTDHIGRPIISVPQEHLPAFAAIGKWSAKPESTASWNPVRRLKLSYKRDNKPNGEDVAKLGLRMIEDYEKGAFMVVEPLNKQIDSQLANTLEASAKVLYVTPAFRITAIPPSNVGALQASQPAGPDSPTNDPMWIDLWGMRNVRAPIAWKKVNSSPIVVAVIDTGADYTHEDLRNNMWSNSAGKHGYDFVDDDSDPMDQNGHGTHCSGTVGAIGNNHIGVVGVNWKVEIMAVRWLDAAGSGDVINAIKAIDFAVDNGATVLSNSWFWTEDDPDLEAAIARARDSKVLFISAAGNFAERDSNNDGDNDKADTFGRIPSAYPLDNIIAVAAIDEAEARAPFSEWGKNTVHLSAPGVLIKSTVLHNDYDGTYSGTSMATPHVAGAAALAMARFPSASYIDIKNKLINNVRRIPSMKDRCTSDGTLDLSFLK